MQGVNPISLFQSQRDHKTCLLETCDFSTISSAKCSIEYVVDPFVYELDRAIPHREVDAAGVVAAEAPDVVPQVGDKRNIGQEVIQLHITARPVSIGIEGIIGLPTTRSDPAGAGFSAEVFGVWVKANS